MIFYAFVFIVSFIFFYRSVSRGSIIAYFFYSFSGILTIAAFSYFIYDVGLAFDSGARRISVVSLVFSLFTFILWQGKVSMRILNDENSSTLLRVLVRIFFMGANFPFSILSRKMYQKFDVERKIS